MKPFRGKRDASTSPPRRRKTDVPGRAAPPSHRLTVDLSRAERLAAMIARSRAAKFVEVADLLAAIYIYEWERLSRFWEDQEEIEVLLQNICSISPQRWNHWIQDYDAKRQDDERDRLGEERVLKRSRAEDFMLPRSGELEKIYSWAEELAAYREEVGNRKIPVLTSECVLLCIARNPQSELSRKLRETALDLGALERAARDPRRAPSH
jgi:hypothetical protein